jgi:hypothetical protein
MPDRKHIQSIEGGPKPADIFQPHLVGVELFEDMDAAVKVIDSLLQKAGWRWYTPMKTSGTLKFRVPLNNGTVGNWQFTVTLTNKTAGKRQLRLDR